jgi:alpha-L-rhamnosidase
MKSVSKVFITLILIVIYSMPVHSAEGLSVYDLRCEYLDDPIGIDGQNPRLSWKIKSDQGNQQPVAYQILAATNPEKLNNNSGDAWDSGKVYSDQSVHIPYSGRKLESRMQVFWKVRIWDQDDRPSAWSETARWEMGLASADWQAKWTGDEQRQVSKEKGINPALYFRKRIQLSAPVRKARVYISGLGYYELYINGEKIGDHVLSPNHTNYDRRNSQEFTESRVGKMATRVLYETYDITSSLKAGENVAAVSLGNGWYFQNDRSEDEPLSYNTPRFIAQLEIELLDGSIKVINSDETWKSDGGPILHNGLYNGEIYDARLEQYGWNTSDFDDGQWKQAITVRPPEGKLMAQMSPPDRVVNTIKPISLSMPAEGTYRYDLGQVISGWARLKIKGSRGSKIKLKFVEEYGFNYGQTDTYILKGGGPEVWEPRFTWHAFRYIDVLDAPFPMTIDNLEGRVVNTDVKSAGTFKCSNTLFNKILENFWWTQLGNMHGGIPSDCPHRERRGYTGDGQIAAQAAIYVLDMATFYTKWLNDISDAQNKTTGYVPNTVPYQNGGGGAAWGSAYIIIPWYMYLYYGDVQILEKHYTGMKQWIGYLQDQTDEDGIVLEKMLGEWVPPQPTEIPPSFVSTAYFYFDLRLMSEIAKVLDNKTDAEFYKKLAIYTKKGFHNKYYNKDKKSYSIGRQGANVFPLGFDMVPDSLLAGVFRTLVKNLDINTKGHFDTGMMGTPLLLDVLTRNGRADLAYTLMNQRDFPSFGYSIDKGATTLWETWHGNESHSHPMFGSVCQWFYQALGGIYPDPEHPGFKHIIIKPQPVSGLKFATTIYHSLYGEIRSHWELKNENLRLDVKIPANTSASVYLPARNQKHVSVKGSEVSFVELKGQNICYRLGAGDYSFISENVGSLIKAPMLSKPRIFPADSLILLPDAAAVRMMTDVDGAEIRYTLDGNEPGLHSLLYKHPFKIYKSRTIKAKVFKKGYPPGFTKTSMITFIDPEKNGLMYDYFEGRWERLPEFKSLRPLKSGNVFDLGLEKISTPANEFALLFSGKIEINTSGEYLFYLNSNDGSQLFIDDILVIDNDGAHASIEKRGKISLLPGKHLIKITYFQAGGGLNLRAFISGPGMEKQRIPAAMLFTQ